MIELLSVKRIYPKTPPPVLVSVWYRGYSMGVPVGLRVLHQMVEKVGDDPSEFAPHSLRIDAARTLAAGGEVPAKVIQREITWKSSESPESMHT